MAPMMDCTDRHCRYFHRRYSRHARLYTEMIAAQALVHGDRARLLAFNREEHPVALQIGGSDPDLLSTATRLGCDAGYDEVNLNVGCPSKRVRSGRFGACLMAEPDHVARCADAMVGAAGRDVEVTIKCRIGIDDQDPHKTLPRFIRAIAGSGIRTVLIHARKAILGGLSPEQNRRIPPLDYPLVLRMKAEFPDISIVINGGLSTLDQAKEQLDAGIDGAMFGRAAYGDPAAILGAADRRLFDESLPDVSSKTAVLAMLPYIESELRKGQRLHAIVRHMMGAFTGRPGARYWRRHLASATTTPNAGPELVENALKSVDADAA